MKDRNHRILVGMFVVPALAVAALVLPVVLISCAGCELTNKSSRRGVEAPDAALTQSLKGAIMAESNDNTVEEWRAIEGFDGYMVSSHGRVRSLTRIVGGRWGNQIQIGRILKTPLSHGYPIVCLRIHGKGIPKKVHRLVAYAFLGISESRPEVNHIDGDKTNNRLSNLEMVTCKENIRHAWKIGLNKPRFGTANSFAKLNDDIVRTIRSMASSGINHCEISRRLKVCRAVVQKIVVRKSWPHVA